MLLRQKARVDMWWKVLIGIAAFNVLVMFCCVVVGARSDRQMEKFMESEVQDG